MKYPDNSPYNQPVLIALESLAEMPTPDEYRDYVLGSQPSDDLGGLREFARRTEVSDYWRDEIQLLEPKKEIAEYVEAAGIPVPRRYGSVHHAMEIVAAGGTVVARSEHPDEYDGPSGLFDSYVINSARIHPKLTGLNRNLALVDNPTLAIQDTVYNDMNRPGVVRYVALTDQDHNGYGDELSYSFWEYVPGTNIKIVADDVIAEQYHVVTSGSTPEGKLGRSGSGYIIETNGEVVRGSELDGGMAPDVLTSVVAQYEAVRSLPAFSPYECPIMEFQRDDSGIVRFLQYHKSRSYRPTDLRLNTADYSVKEGWMEAKAVRGAVGEMLTLGAAIFYPRRYGETISGYSLPVAEDASFDISDDVGLTEALARKRIVSLLPTSFDGVYNGLACNHERSSKWFKPIASLAIGNPGFNKLIPTDLKMEISEKVHKQGVMARVSLDVASDGHQGFVRLTPGAEQPIIESR